MISDSKDTVRDIIKRIDGLIAMLYYGDLQEREAGDILIEAQEKLRDLIELETSE